tara:strand:- start:424 stop:2574 length:2151 start_codon:yes stop_codon:yes gene_type:complete
MVQQTSVIDIKFLTKGEGEVAKAFKKLRGETVRLNRDFKSLSKDSIAKVKNEFNKLGGGARNSINAMQAQRNALNGLRNMADVTSVEFRELTRDIALLDAKMRTAGAGATGFKGRLKGFAKGAGAVAAAGIFGGPEGAIGAGIGALTGGGPVGAAVGGAIGAQVGMVRKQLGGLTEFSAQLALQRKALRLVIGDTEKFNKSQKFLLETSRKLAIPQDVITRQFTSLTASVVGAGKSVSDAEEVFKAIAAGIRGTGGSLEDMKAAMRATAQVFSKGKVSAEELRQQLGERLPGAFTLFAESMDKTPAELDKALEQGKVTLDDFMKFSQTLFKTYGKNAEILAQGPEAAGDRLKTALTELGDNIGQLLRPIGADFQTEFSKIVVQINNATFAVRKFFKIGEEFQKEKLDELLIERGKIEKEIAAYEAAIPKIPLGFRGTTGMSRAQAQSSLDALKEKLKDVNINIQTIETSIAQVNSETNKTNENTNNLKNTSVNAFEAMKLGVNEYLESIKDMSKQIKDTFVNAFKSMEDALVQFVLTGKLNFKNLAQSILADLARMIVRQQMFNALSGLKNFINPFLPKGPADNVADKMSFGRSPLDAALQVDDNATGNAFSRNGIVPYRKGGIVSSPTMFKFGGSNLGIMGEAGPEAILPLQRGKGGKLGVIAQGGGAVNVTVNVDATSSSVEGDEQNANEFGEQIATAVQAVIINEKRVGGLLS